MEEASDSRAELWVRGRVKAGDCQDLGQEQADAQLPVNRRAIATNSC